MYAGSEELNRCFFRVTNIAVAGTLEGVPEGIAYSSGLAFSKRDSRLN
jgi:hypothetical protein